MFVHCQGIDDQTGQSMPDTLIAARLMTRVYTDFGELSFLRKESRSATRRKTAI
jgi:hypothetical protein